MKRVLSILLISTLCLVMLGGCEWHYAVQNADHALSCLQRMCDEGETAFVLSDLKRCSATPITQEFVDALRMEEWVVAENDSYTIETEAMTCHVVTENEAVDEFQIAVGKNCGGIGVTTRYRMYLDGKWSQLPMTDWVYFDIPQQEDGELFETVHAILAPYLKPIILSSESEETVE